MFSFVYFSIHQHSLKSPFPSDSLVMYFHIQENHPYAYDSVCTVMIVSTFSIYMYNVRFFVSSLRKLVV